MKRYTIFIFLFMVFHALVNAQAFIVPASGNNDASILGCDSVQLTPNATFQQGTVWYRNQLNLNNPFDFTFHAFFGINNGVGADGMAFIIQNQNQTLGPQGALGGAQLGYFSFPGKSMAIEFDTHNNGAGAPYGDIPVHHIAIDTGGIQFPPAAAPVPALPSSANLDDGAWHKIEIVWVPGTQTMTVYFDGNLRLSCVFNPGLVAQVFGGQNMLYWGWAGCTGSKFDQQQIAISLQANFTAAINYSQCSLVNVPFTDSSVSGLKNIASWNWDFGDGGSSTQQNPVHTYAASGIYNVKLTVTDGGGCTSDTTIAVSVHSSPLITPSQSNVTCNGLNNGVARAITTQGTPPYTFTWLPAVSTVDSAIMLSPGNYVVVVTDPNHCGDTAIYTITQPAALVDSITKTNVLCFGQTTGSIINTVTGGTSAYTYLWNPSVSTTSSASNLASGTYLITIADANACNLHETVNITEPTLLTAMQSDSNVLCYGTTTGFMIVNTSGGTQPYSYNWNPNVTIGDSAMQLGAGTYNVTVTDANACSLSLTATITQPTQLIIYAEANSVLCFGQNSGTIIIQASGASPAYTYSISSGGAPITQAADTFNNLAPTTYAVLVTDTKGCTADTTVTVNQPPQLVALLADTNPTCYHYHNGKIIVTATGGTGADVFTFSDSTIHSTGDFYNLPAGSYGVTVTDAAGCKVSDSAVLTEPDSVLIEVSPTPIQVKLGQTLQLTSTTNQTGAVNYAWSPDFGLSCYDCSDPVFNGVYSQPYFVIATNENQCIGTFAFTVTVVPDYDIFFPNAFTPGTGGVNADWQVFGNLIAIKQMEVKVFDRIGEKVFESNDVNYRWDGTFKGHPVPVGVYTYECKVVWLNNYTDKTFIGSITLLR